MAGVEDDDDNKNNFQDAHAHRGVEEVAGS